MLIQPAAVVRDLCLHLDSELSTKQHVNKVAAICYYHLRRLRQSRSEVTIWLVLALIMSRIDYCNSALAGLPQSTTAPLQRVKNAAARPKEHVTPSLLQLHWLPVRWRVQFKICCLMHSIHRGNSPEYLKNMMAGRYHPRMMHKFSYPVLPGL